MNTNETYVLSAHWSNEDWKFQKYDELSKARSAASAVLDDPLRNHDSCYLLSLSICYDSGLILEKVYSIWDPDVEPEWKFARAEEAHFWPEDIDYSCFDSVMVGELED